MNKLLVGGALGALLIAGQAIAARLPDMVVARAADPAVATAVTAEPATAPAARRAAPVAASAELAMSPMADRLDPVAGDPAGVAGVGPLTEAEAARLAVGLGQNAASLSSIDISPPDCGSDGTCVGHYTWVPVAVGAAIVATAIVVATDDDSDS